MKKILALVLALSLALSLFCAVAEEAAAMTYDEYVAAELDTDLLRRRL